MAGLLDRLPRVGLQGVDRTPSGFGVRGGSDVVVYLAPPRAVPLVVPDIQVVVALDHLHADAVAELRGGGMEFPLLKGNSGVAEGTPGALDSTFENGPIVEPARRIADTIALVFRSSIWPSCCSMARCGSPRNRDSTGVAWARYAGANSARIWPIVGTAFTIARPVAPNIPLNILTPGRAPPSGDLKGSPPHPFRWRRGRDPHPPVSARNAYGHRPPWYRWLKVLLVSLTRDVSEITALVRSAGHELVETIVQVREAPDRRFFVGKGKLEEIENGLERRDDVYVVLFNGELHPSQHYVLEKRLKRQCYDRLRLILEIFAERAHGREAKLQVELALLHYETPLLREWIHTGAEGERPGFMAGGEYRVDVYLETVKRRQRRIEEELELVRKERSRRRASRKDRGFHLVSLAGYANAGKSSMLNALTGERVLVEERMFSTLSTTTRAVPGRRRILLTDTVGFVDQVPFWMVEAFNSTFEEIYDSDLILLLVDASDPEPEILRKVRLAARTLLPRVAADAIFPVLTKVDRVPPERLGGGAPPPVRHQVLPTGPAAVTQQRASPPGRSGAAEQIEVVAR